jgi:hypothetical protein
MKTIDAGAVEHLPSFGFSQKGDCPRALRTGTNIDNADYRFTNYE